jgi:hypothetical protein
METFENYAEWCKANAVPRDRAEGMDPVGCRDRAGEGRSLMEEKRKPSQGELFRYYVSVSDGSGPQARRSTEYNGTDAADAMAAYSKGVSERYEYVVLEALRERQEGA